MRTGEIAKAFQVDPSTVRRWCDRGCPHEWKGPQRSFSIEAVRAWVEEQKAKRERERTESQRLRAEKRESAKRRRELAEKIMRVCWSVSRASHEAAVKRLARMSEEVLANMLRFWEGVEKERRGAG